MIKQTYPILGEHTSNAYRSMLKSDIHAEDDDEDEFKD